MNFDETALPAWSRKGLPVTEMFDTFQGEGDHLGKPAFFIRLHGCPVHCSWCDAASTWHKDYLPANVIRWDEEDLAKEAFKSSAPIVVITGGEPAIHDLAFLVMMLKSGGKKVHIETSGAFDIAHGTSITLDWITVSPKWNALPYASMIYRADELKLIIDKPEDITLWWNEIADKVKRGISIWLHPQWGKREDPDVLNAISDSVCRYPERGYRAGWQLHKLYKVDALDQRSIPLAPLGGRPEQGY